MEITWSSKKVLKIVLLSAFLLFIIIYAFFRAKDVVLGVKIIDVNIVDGTKMTDNILKITGNASISLWNITSMTETAIGYLLYPRIRNSINPQGYKPSSS